MTCCGLFCGSPDEAKKPTPFVSCDGHIGEQDKKEGRARIPWVWSRKFLQNYQLGEKLGQGSFAVVHEATSLAPPHQSFAVKVVNRRKLSRKQLVDFKDEVQILADLQHESVVRLFELYKESGFFFVVMEKLSGGELFDLLCEIQTYNERDARDAMRVIFGAMAYCHSQRIAHR